MTEEVKTDVQTAPEVKEEPKAPVVEAKPEVKSDAATAVYTQDQVDALTAAIRKEATERALAKAGVSDLEAQVKLLNERAEAADKAAREAELKALSAEFGVDKDLFEETKKKGDELRSYVEKLSKLKGDAAPEQKRTLSQATAPKTSGVAVDGNSFGARAAAAAAKLAGGQN